MGGVIDSGNRFSGESDVIRKENTDEETGSACSWTPPSVAPPCGEGHPGRGPLAHTAEPQ